MTTTGEWAELPGGFRIPAGSTAALLAEKLTDRALLQLVITLTPGYQTSSGIEKNKTDKQRQSERDGLNLLLRVMVNDFGIRTADGSTEYALLELAVERGLVTRHDEAPLWRVRYGYAAWSLLDVMTAGRYGREYPGRRTASRGPRYAGGSP